MKLKIYIKYSKEACKIQSFKKGDWIDLISNLSHKGSPGDYRLLPLGVAMQLPKGFEAIVAPRSSTFSKYGFSMPNSIGVIDHTYSGDTDEWMCPAYFSFHGCVQQGDRICQFRIQLSQKASLLNKLKWLFSSGIEFIEVDHLSNSNRGGFGTSGTQKIINS